MTWQTAVDRTVTGLGYELVEVERSARGLLRVFIDRVPGTSYPTGESEMVTVDDCEAVTRQLQYVLEVENVDYERLEVSSPGLDRPLKKAADYERFAGSELDLTLKLPLAGRKKFRGMLLARPDGDGWRLVFNDGKGDQALDFSLDEVREARLVPVVDFKGRRGRKADEAAAVPAADEQVDGGHKE
jgi:ribosome maturation factor RimP